MDFEGFWKLISFVILIQIIQCKKYMGKHKNGAHFLISTKQAANIHGSSKLNLHNKKSSRHTKAWKPFFNQSREHWIQKKNILKESIKISNDYQIVLNSAIIPTGK